MIHYITPVGIEAAWVAKELEILEQRGVPWVLHSLHRPRTIYYGSEWAAQVNRQTRVLRPVSRWRVTRAMLAAPIRFRGRFLAALANALFGQREHLRARLSGLASLAVATDWATQLKRQAGAEPVDRIHAQWIHASGTVGLYGAWLLGVPFSFTGHAADLFRNRVALLDKIRRADLIVCISTFHRQFYLDRGGRPEQMLIVYCGIDTRDFPYRPPVRRPGQPVRILSIGRLIEKKGFDVLIEACRLLRDRGAAFTCEIAGDGPLEAELRHQVAAAGLVGQVVVTGTPILQENLSEWMATGHLFAQPCVWARDDDVDGTPRTLMEAMATGLPSVSTCLAGIPDIIENRRSGLLVEPRDAVALADALDRLIADPALAAELGRAGRERMVANFDLEHCVNPLVERFSRDVGLHGAHPLTPPQEVGQG